MCVLWSARVHPDFFLWCCLHAFSNFYLRKYTGCSDCQIVSINIAERYTHAHKTSPRLQSGCVQAGLMLADKGVTSPNNTNLSVKRHSGEEWFSMWLTGHWTEITWNNQKKKVWIYWCIMCHMTYHIQFSLRRVHFHSNLNNI